MDDGNEDNVTLGAANESGQYSNADISNRLHLSLVRTVYTSGIDITPSTAETLFGIAASEVQASMRQASDLHRRLCDQVLQSHFKVPANVFAKSCPTCDEMATEKMDPEFVPRYPKGWELVACRRHASALKTSSPNSKDFLVGGVAEARTKAATRYYSARRSTLHADKAAEKKAAAAAAAAAAETGAPSPTPNTPSTSPPPTSAEKDPCPICVEGTPNLTLDCSHSFCTPCLTTWQQNFSDQKLTAWVQSSDTIQRCYPILAANLKSRFTCPMCRTWLQYTHQSRRKRKLQNRVMRGEEIAEGEVGSARSRRGGREGRKRRAKMARMSRMARAEREEAGDGCPDAPAGMPVVQRL